MQLFLARITRALIKRAVTWHRVALKATATDANNAYNTDQFFAECAREHLVIAERRANAAFKHSLAVDAAVDAELATLPEYK